MRLWDLRDISRPLYDFGNSTGREIEPLYGSIYNIAVGNVCDIQWLPYWNSLLCAGDTSAVSYVLNNLESGVLNNGIERCSNIALI